MLTTQKLIKECPLSQFNTIPLFVPYFDKGHSQSKFAIKEACQVWNYKLYHTFIVNMGCLIEQILFENSYFLQVKLFNLLGIIDQIPQVNFMYQQVRSQTDTLGKFVDQLKVYNTGYSKRSLIDTKCNVFKSFSLVSAFSLDYDVHKILHKNLTKIQTIRNTYTHGNIKQFMSKLYPNHVLPFMTKFEFNFENGSYDPSKTVDFSPRVSDLHNAFILLHLYPQDIKIRPYLNEDIKNLFLQTLYILNWVFDFINTNEFKTKFNNLPK